MSEPTPAGPNAGDRFRWHALLQRAKSPLFLLDHERRLRFVNRAWEELTGLSAAEVRLLSCKRKKPAAAGESTPEMLAHALSPPAEVLEGQASRARRRMAVGRGGQGWQWWDVEFQPLGDVGYLGRIVPVPGTLSSPVAQLPEKLVNWREQVVRRYDVGLLETQLPMVRRLADQVKLAAGLSVPVLFVGEAGTGKESLARAVHYGGLARERPLAALDGQRLPLDALLGVLFPERGHAPGHPGAVYLREPARLPRELQQRVVEQIGAGKGPRVLAGTRAKLEGDARVVPEFAAIFPLVLEVPPLRERRIDLPAIVERLLTRGANDGSPVTGLTPAAWELVRAESWPGNLRELAAALQVARHNASANRGPLLDVPDFPAALRLRHAAGAAPTPNSALPLDKLLEQAERRIIELALQRSKGHRGRAAELLGIWRARLLRRIEALGIGSSDDEVAIPVEPAPDLGAS